MERPIFPSKYMRITQGYHEGSHKDSFAIDNADKDSGISRCVRATKYKFWNST